MTSFESSVADLDYMVQELAKQRRKVDSAKRDIAKIETLMHRQFPEYAEAKIQLKVAQDQEKTLDTQLRQDALEEWTRGDTDGDKSALHPAVKIKEYTTLEYDVDAAIDYCREHLPKALKLNKRPFESVAKVADLDFVKIDKEPRATIQRDLSPWMEE